ncbi:unnamed protein product [Rhizophagus irregularis]|nr:unnamed protein product [Rhizophagus irregularis]
MDDLNLHDYLQISYIEIDTQKIDIDLLRKLFNGKAITEINANQCSTIISKGSRTKNVNVHLLRLYVLVYISPPPLRKNFKDNLQVMIKEATEKDDVVTSQGNILKAYLIKKLFKKSTCH